MRSYKNPGELYHLCFVTRVLHVAWALKYWQSGYQEMRRFKYLRFNVSNTGTIEKETRPSKEAIKQLLITLHTMILLLFKSERISTSLDIRLGEEAISGY